MLVTTMFMTRGETVQKAVARLKVSEVLRSSGGPTCEFSSILQVSAGCKSEQPKAAKEHTCLYARSYNPSHGSGLQPTLIKVVSLMSHLCPRPALRCPGLSTKPLLNRAGEASNTARWNHGPRVGLGTGVPRHTQTLHADTSCERSPCL